MDIMCGLLVSQTSKHENPFLSFSRKFRPSKITAYTVNY